MFRPLQKSSCSLFCTCWSPRVRRHNESDLRAYMPLPRLVSHLGAAILPASHTDRFESCNLPVLYVRRGDRFSGVWQLCRPQPGNCVLISNSLCILASTCTRITAYLNRPDDLHRTLTPIKGTRVYKAGQTTAGQNGKARGFAALPFSRRFTCV